MNKLIKITLALVIFSSLLGPSFKLPVDLPPINLYLSDIFVFVLSVLLCFKFRKIKSIFQKELPVQAFFAFIIFSLFTFFISPVNLTLFERLVSLLYVIRFSLYFSIYLGWRFFVANDKSDTKFLRKSLILTGLGFIATGWLQYFLYPDLRNLSYLGWDPHYKRIFALIFDPNYLGLILVLYFCLLHTKIKKNLKDWIVEAICLITIAFTYSRSSFTALLAAAFYFGLNSKKLLLYLSVILLFIFSLFILPRPAGEGVKLERLFSISERLSNWKSASLIIYRYPIFGIGFNTLRFARKSFNSLPEDWLTSHSAAGVDNSFLFVASTTGLTGLSLYLYFLFVLFKNLSISGKSVLIAVIVHSFFLNSLFFTFILIWLWSILALETKEEFKKNS